MRIHKLNFLRGPAERYRRLTMGKKVASVVSMLALLVLGGVGVMLGSTQAVSYYTWDKSSPNPSNLQVSLTSPGRSVSIDGASVSSGTCWVTGPDTTPYVTIYASCLKNYDYGVHTIVVTQSDGSDISRTLTIYGILTNTWQQQSGSSIRTAWPWYPSNGVLIDGGSISNSCVSTPATPTSDNYYTTISGSCLNSLGLSVGQHSVTLNGNDGANATFYFTVTAAPVTTYTITFNANGGSVSPTSKTVNAGDALGTLPTPTYTSYTFSGWYTAATGGTQVTASTVPTGNATYYAHWTRNTYTITFNANGGSTSETTRTINTGAAIGTLPTPTRTNYTFNGWYTAATGGTKISASTVPTGNTTYYAQWTRNTYTLTFDPHDGSAVITKTINTGDAIGNQLPAAPTRAGHTFKGWYTACNGGTQVTANTKPTSAATYCAQWDGPTLTLNNNGSYRKNSGQTAIATPAVKKNAPANVYVDGNKLTSGQYTYDSNTGKITLSTEFLDTLKAGEHELKIDWGDDTTSTIKFTIEKIGPELKIDNDGKHEQGSDKTITVTPVVNKGVPEYVKIDNNKIDSKCYVTDGKVGTVTVLPECLNKLDEGEHTLTIGWNDDTESTTKFMITKSTVPVPNTGMETKSNDDSNEMATIIYALPVVILAMVFLGGWFYRVKKSHRKFDW